MGECRAGTAVQCSAVVLPCRPEIALPLLPSTHQLPPAIANRPLTATHPSLECSLQCLRIGPPISSAAALTYTYDFALSLREAAEGGKLPGLRALEVVGLSEDQQLQVVQVGQGGRQV